MGDTFGDEVLRPPPSRLQSIGGSAGQAVGQGYALATLADRVGESASWRSSLVFSFAD